ncbi:MAG: hypothetical protein PHN88_00435 [Ignavibacteria bacterium]|nr:hypothetical protein [Ignavibacteria bacterium]
MKKYINSFKPVFLIILLSSVLFPGCEFIGDVFKTGIWVGIIIVIAVIAIIALLIKMVSK